MLRGATQAVVVALLWQLATYACAHMMPAQQGTVNLVDKAAFVVLSLPVSALTLSNNTIDANHDGLLSAQELQLHHTKIEQQVIQRVRLYDGKHAGTVDFIQVNAEAGEQNQSAHSASNTALGASQFLVLLKISFATEPSALRMETDFFGKASSEKQFIIKAIQGKETEAIVLRVGHPEYHFFRSPLRVLYDYMVIGCAHILLGFDHLLFLLTIIVAAVGWRYWLAVLTSFTFAHSITLTLSLMGAVKLPSQIIEPLIAASIVLMAGLNLWRREIGILPRLALVFACGLLHGLGFASSIADIGLHGTNFFMSLLGFNLGIEIGQAVFLLLILMLAGALTQLKRMNMLTKICSSLPARTITSAFALIAGFFWLIQGTLNH